MKKGIRLITALTAALMVTSSSLMGCSSSKSSSSSTSSPVTLSMYSNITDVAFQNTIKEIASNFEKENTGIKLDITFPGSEYENILKVKMASNEMPDIFDTHGWAQLRYGNYLMDLKDSSWVSKLDSTIKPVVTDSKGKVYCLPLNEAKDGIIYNKTLLNKYGIAVPKTVDELVAAAEKISKASNGQIKPFFLSGVDNWMVGQLVDVMATPMLISAKTNSADALLNKSFDWSKWNTMGDFLLKLKNEGLVNEDVLTAKSTDLPKRFAEGKTVFCATMLSVADDVKAIDSSVELGVMPAPAFDSTDTPSFSGGERQTLGVWKDTKYKEQCLKVLDYFAKQENQEKIATVGKYPSALTGISVASTFQKDFDSNKDTRVFAYFDRVYLPNGMWDVICKNGVKLLAGQIKSSDYSSVMKSEFTRLSTK